jgi:hypothetical protein
MPDEQDEITIRPESAPPEAAERKKGPQLVGTGIGAAAGAAAGGALGGLGGPVGMAMGAAAGAVAGGLIGKSTGDALSSPAEDAFWRELYQQGGFHQTGSFEDFLPAFRAGEQGWNRHRSQGTSFGEVKGEIQHEFEANRRGSRVEWPQAREAAYLAWKTLAHPAYRFRTFEVTDRNGNRIGEVDRIWTDESGRMTFLSVKSGWLTGAVQVFPSTRYELLEKNRRLMLPFSQAKVREGPSYTNVDQLTEKEWSELLHYYDAQEEASAEDVHPA